MASKLHDQDESKSLIKLIAEIAKLPETALLRWCAFCAVLLDLGLIESCEGFLQALRLDASTVKLCKKALSSPVFPGSSVEIKRLLSKQGVDAVRCAAAAADVRSQGATGSNNTRSGSRGSSALLALVDATVSSGECFSLDSLAVSGVDLINLGHKPGPEIGKKLNKLLDHVIEQPKHNTREQLLNIIAMQISSSD